MLSGGQAATRFAGLLAGLTMSFMADLASAGDTASLNVLGYSPDGKVFAFEEYGVSDGAGFPYSNIYFIDIIEDKFLPDTPIRVHMEEEGPLGKVRDMARSKAAALTAKYLLADNPGVIVAYNPPSEIDSDPGKIRYYRYVSAPPHDYTDTLVLKEKDFPISKDCAGFADSYKGFTLRLTEYQGQPMDKVLHDDASVPKSRLCPNEYRIGAVVSSEIRDVTPMAMILVGTYGFEGNDRRWIAVPVNPYGQ
jgi:predicted secreted protein